MNRTFSVQAKFFKGFSDPTRLAILSTLIKGEKTVGQIVELVGCTQSNVSNHLKCLSGCGIVEKRQVGKNIYYSLRDIKTKELLSLSQEVINKVAPDIESCLELEKLV